MTAPCPYGPTAQTPLCQYPCPGGCGCWVPVPSACFHCWFGTWTYEPRAVRMLPAEDPRRTKLAADPRDARRRPPRFGRSRA